MLEAVSYHGWSHGRSVYSTSVVVAICLGICAPSLGDDQRAVARWTAKAESWRSKIDDEDAAALVDVALAAMYAIQGNTDKSLAAARRVVASDSRAAASHMSDVMHIVAEHLGDDAANGLLRSMEDASQRDQAARRVILEQGSKGRLAAARQTAKLVKSIEARNEAWMWFAMAASVSRRFDVAQQGLREVEPQNDDQQTRLDHSWESIARRSREPAKKPATPEELWERAKDSNESSHWRRAATALLNRGDHTKGRDALRRAEAAGENIELYSIQVANLTLIAHLYLETDDFKAAARVARKAVKVLKDSVPLRDEQEPAFDIEGLIGGMLVSPVLINVLARSGELDQAFDLAQTSGQWIDLGAGCISAELQVELQKRLAKIPSRRDRALVCIGVVQGMLKCQTGRAETRP